MINFSDDNRWTVGGAYYANESDATRARQIATEREASNQARTTAWLARQLAGVGFESEAEMLEWAGLVAVEARGVLASDEHLRMR